METAVPLVLLCICLQRNHAQTAPTPAVTRSPSNASTAHTGQSPIVPDSDVKSQSQQELDILQLLGWQNVYKPVGYAIVTELPANCTTQTWQSLGSLAALTDLSLTGNLLNLPDSWAAIGAFPSLSTLNLSSTTLTGMSSFVASKQLQVVPSLLQHTYSTSDLYNNSSKWKREQVRAQTRT